VAWPAARSSTFIPTLAYAPESPTMRARTPVNRPSWSHPAQYSSCTGWRLGCRRKLSSRDRVHLTGRRRSQAASAVWAWFDMSSLPPKAPPLDTSSTLTWSWSVPSTAAIWSRSSQIPGPRVDVQAAVGAGHGQARLGLEEGVLDALGLEDLVYHVGAGGQGCTHVTRA